MHFRQEQFFRSERVILPFDTSFCFFPTKKLKKRKYIFKHATAKKNQRRHSADRLIKLQHKCSL